MGVDIKQLINSRGRYYCIHMASYRTMCRQTLRSYHALKGFLTATRGRHPVNDTGTALVYVDSIPPAFDQLGLSLG